MRFVTEKCSNNHCGSSSTDGPACPVSPTVITMGVLPAVITMSFRLEVQMVYQHATSEHHRSHLARLQIAADIADRTQSESDQANDDDRCQDCREVTKDAPLPAPCFSGSPRLQRRGDYPQWAD